MNREQKRKVKKAVKSGIKSGKIRIDKVKSFLEDTIRAQVDSYGIKEYDKVKLNYDKIVSDVNFPNMNPKFQQWIHDSKDKIFTVEFDEEHSKNKMFCNFAEDANDVKWLIFVGDLIKINQVEDNTYEGDRNEN